MNDISAIRKEYKLRSLDESGTETDPVEQFRFWWKEAIDSHIDEVNAMTLATAGTDGRPSARIVLLKGFDGEGFVFFTNYKSHKGTELERNPYASLVFFWKELERQIRIEGITEKLTETENETYFLSRPAGSQLGAWASPQSQVINGRAEIENKLAALQQQYAVEKMKCPPFWGGFRVKPDLYEFWQGRESRLHDRIQYKSKGGLWVKERLAP